MSDNPIVNVSGGALRGVKKVAKTGTTYYSFSGIPYAAPPVGSLRFKAPQAPEPWTGIRDAQKEGNVCPHMDFITNSYVGEEDCLFINVNTPQLPKDKEQLKKAVMVFIHGGGFTLGSGNALMYGSDYLVSEDVLLLTFNYRIGALGFLTTEDREVPGNAGLKDMVAALKWVQQNIARFGGDPGNVTIFGESAGSAAVHYLVLSPLAKGLLHRAIAQSGVATNRWASTNAGRSRTLRLAKFLGCTSEDSREVVEFLQIIPVKKLVDHISEALSAEEVRRGVIDFPFLPVCEAGIESSEDTFLPKNSLDIIRSGNYNRVPMIFGVTSNEGIMMLRELFNKPEELAKMDRDFQRYLPGDIFPQLDTARSKAAAKKLKSFYFGDEPLSQDTILQFSHMCSDAYFVHRVNEAVNEHAIHANAANPLYLYEFDFDGELGILKRMFGLGSVPGACHGDDVGYLFRIEFSQLELSPDSPEMKMLAKMVKMWTNFAKTGNPSAEVPWTPVAPGKTCYLRIDEESTMKNGNVAKDRMAFWEDLYRP